MKAMPCSDCRVDTLALGEYYMVHRYLWHEVHPGRGYLCIGCLESRLGRQLTAADFTDCPLNKFKAEDPDSPRLRDRLTRRPLLAPDAPGE